MKPRTLAARDLRAAFVLATTPAWALALSAGCQRPESKVVIANPMIEPRTFAVAPVLNFSGHDDFDPVQVADLLASELSFVDGATVLPVNRVVSYLASQGRTQIDSPEHALAVARAVGADAIWVAGITEYDPYTPVVGIVLQVYEHEPRPSMQVDPRSASRQAQAVSLPQVRPAVEPLDQVQVIYNAQHAHTYDAVRKYAEPRGETDNPYGWKQYLKVQTLFIRFCWHDAIERVLAEQHWRRQDAALAETESPE